MKKPLLSVTRCCFSSELRSGSVPGLPMRNAPGGIQTRRVGAGLSGTAPAAIVGRKRQARNPRSNVHKAIVRFADILFMTSVFMAITSAYKGKQPGGYIR